MTTNDNPPTNMISLVDIKAKKEDAATDVTERNRSITRGLDSLKDALDKEGHGFIALAFDNTSDPRLIWCGDFDIIKAIGCFDLAKVELANQLFAEPME